MKMRNPFLIKTVSLLGAIAVRRLLATLDIRIDFGPWGRHPTPPSEGRYLYTFWHDVLIAPTIFKSPTRILISHHADGELIAQVVKHLGFGTVRGSTSRGGTAAVLEMMRVARRSHLCVTPDGPRGPRHRAQAGTVFLSSQTGLPIVPVGVGFSSAWRMRSWDRFAIPKPFSSVRYVAAAPLVVPPGLGGDSLKPYLSLLQERLDTATREAEEWAAGRPRRTPAPQTVPLAQASSIARAA